MNQESEIFDINLTLRTDVLNKAINLEKSVTTLLIYFLKVENDEVRTLGNKGTTISFKNKIDLLFDINVLDNEENKQLNLIMEFRNKFLHAYECNSFTVASEMLGSGRGNRLREFCEDKTDKDIETQMREGFFILSERCLRLLEAKIQERDALRKQHRETIKNIVMLFRDTILCYSSFSHKAQDTFDKYPFEIEKSPFARDILNNINELSISMQKLKMEDALNEILDKEMLPNLMDSIH